MGLGGRAVAVQGFLCNWCTHPWDGGQLNRVHEEDCIPASLVLINHFLDFLVTERPAAPDVVVGGALLQVIGEVLDKEMWSI